MSGTQSVYVIAISHTDLLVYDAIVHYLLRENSWAIVTGASLFDRQIHSCLIFSFSGHWCPFVWKERQKIMSRERLWDHQFWRSFGRSNSLQKKSLRLKFSRIARLKFKVPTFIGKRNMIDRNFVFLNMNLLWNDSLILSVVCNSYCKFFISIVSNFYRQKIPTECESFIHSQILLSAFNKFLVYYLLVSASNLIYPPWLLRELSSKFQYILLLLLTEWSRNFHLLSKNRSLYYRLFSAILARRSSLHVGHSAITGNIYKLHSSPTSKLLQIALR